MAHSPKRITLGSIEDLADVELYESVENRDSQPVIERISEVTFKETVFLSHLLITRMNPPQISKERVKYSPAIFKDGDHFIMGGMTRDGLLKTVDFYLSQADLYLANVHSLREGGFLSRAQITGTLYSVKI